MNAGPGLVLAEHLILDTVGVFS
ncbi:uncharacterized protein METZ01_LOCUS57542 [marine metagenome]|uniref:Uncharacterized protein n=1 Tax=marine metagenome TaxID=408172 RepID=A0A381SN09_9ZZZZ